MMVVNSHMGTSRFPMACSLVFKRLNHSAFVSHMQDYIQRLQACLEALVVPMAGIVRDCIPTPYAVYAIPNNVL